MNEPKERSTPNPHPCSSDTVRKPYLPPQLTKRGSVVELTQGGGSIIDDGLGTLEGHL